MFVFVAAATFIVYTNIIKNHLGIIEFRLSGA